MSQFTVLPPAPTSALPTGSATASNQQTQIAAEQATAASVADIDSKTPALGQALASGSVPVVLPAAQITALTPPSSVTVTQSTGTNLHAVIDSGSVSVSNFPATQPVSGTVAVSSIASALPAGSNALGSVSVSNFPATQPVSGTVAVSSLPSIPAGANTIGAISNTSFTATQATGTNLHTVVDSGTVALSAGSAAIGSVSVSNFPGTQPVSGTVAVSSIASALPSGTNTIGAISNTSFAVTQATAANLNATVVQSSGSNLHVNVDNFPTTQPVSAASLPLPTGASTSALQSSVQGSASGGTAATSSQLDGGIYNSTAPTLTNGQQAALQLDVNGNLKTTGTSSVSGNVTVVQPTGTNLHTVVDSGSITLATGANTIGAISNTSFAATQTTASALNATVVQPTAANLNATVAIASAQTLANVTTVGTITNAVTVSQATPASLQATVTQVTATSGNITSVAASTSSTSILASNTARKGFAIYNDSTAIMYLALASTASTTAYTVQIGAGGYYELPFIKTYTGAVSAVWSSATGNARVTELV